jgi:hypothetical protein
VNRRIEIYHGFVTIIMPECLNVDKELFYDINFRRLEEKGCIHGRKNPL